ncbi:hypothetical protein [Klenkia brasiliensis]|nr:hypothetical protein [Klenkia brasiliensis]
MSPDPAVPWPLQLAFVLAMVIGSVWLMDLSMRLFTGQARLPRRRRTDRRRPRPAARLTARRPAPGRAPVRTAGVPQRRAVQAIAADLRRLRRELSLVATGSAAHRAGVLAAYDDVLVEAAGALEVPHRLREAVPGEDREVERLRLAAALSDAGLVVSDPRDRG